MKNKKKRNKRKAITRRNRGTETTGNTHFVSKKREKSMGRTIPNRFVLEMRGGEIRVNLKGHGPTSTSGKHKRRKKKKIMTQAWKIPWAREELIRNGKLPLVLRRGTCRMSRG